MVVAPKNFLSLIHPYPAQGDNLQITLTTALLPTFTVEKDSYHMQVLISGSPDFTKTTDNTVEKEIGTLHP